MGAQVGITFVTLGELVKWATIPQWATRKRSELAVWLKRAADAPVQR